LKHTASKRFWQSFDALPVEVQALANKGFAQLKADPAHPSLAFKSLGSGRFQSVRVGLYYRALGVPVGRRSLVLDRHARRVRQACRLSRNSFQVTDLERAF